MAQGLLVRAPRGPTSRCSAAHMEFITSAQGTSEAHTAWGTSGRTTRAPSQSCTPQGGTPGATGKAGVTWSILIGQNGSPTWPVQDLQRDGVPAPRME